MEKRTIFVLVFFVCRSHQRPQLEADVSTSTTTETAAADTSTEETKESDKIIARVTEAPAVSVQTSINVSSYGPGELFDGFRPSDYYRPDGNPIFERPGPHASHEVVHKPHYFRRPDNIALSSRSPPAKPDEKVIVFPLATQEHYAKRVQYSSNNNNNENDHNNNENNLNNDDDRDDDYNNKNNNNNNGPRSRGPQKFTDFPLAQSKPMKHDYGDVPPDFGGAYDGNFYERHFAKYHGNEMAHYPDVVHDPSKSYHGHASLKNRKDPWRSVLSVLATILPVGLLLASFPPTVIKVNSTQYPYQFQKNATSYNNPNIVTGRYKALRTKNAGRKINGEVEYLDDCLKKKICENIKTTHASSELDSLLKTKKLNLTDSSPMVKIFEAAASFSTESCQVFVCTD